MDIFKRSDSLHNNNKRTLMHHGDKSLGADGSGVESEQLLFVRFFKHYRCYDLIPVSAKLIVLDTQLIVKKAFHALVSNGNPSFPPLLLHSSRSPSLQLPPFLLRSIAVVADSTRAPFLSVYLFLSLSCVS